MLRTLIALATAAVAREGVAASLIVRLPGGCVMPTGRVAARAAPRRLVGAACSTTGNHVIRSARASAPVGSVLSGSETVTVIHTETGSKRSPRAGQSTRRRRPGTLHLTMTVVIAPITPRSALLPRRYLAAKRRSSRQHRTPVPTGHRSTTIAMDLKPRRPVHLRIVPSPYVALDCRQVR